MSATKTALERAGQHLSGVKLTGDPQKIAEAERGLAVAYLERDIERALAVDVDAATRRRLAKFLIAGAPQEVSP